MYSFKTKILATALLSSALTFSGPVFSVDASQKNAEARSPANQSVQPMVNTHVTDATAKKRQQLIADAAVAVAETEKAITALERKKKDEALKSLALATGKLELILARDPNLALAPVSVEIQTIDLLSTPDTVKAMIKQAREYLDDGEILKARPLIATLASEINLHTTNIPLGTYPAAIKAVTPLIDAGKIEEAKAKLQAALNTLVITTEIIPLPKLRAELMLKEAQTLAEKKTRSKEENDKLGQYLKSSREQLQIAEMLGYAKKKDYKPLYKELEEIEKKSAGGKSGTGWFDRIKRQLSDWF